MNPVVIFMLLWLDLMIAWALMKITGKDNLFGAMWVAALIIFFGGGALLRIFEWATGIALV